MIYTFIPPSKYKDSDIELVHGGCPTGPDSWVEDYAEIMEEHKVTIFPADWDKHGKAAGPIRNKSMAKYSDALLLIWDGSSKGSHSMKKEMLKLKKPVYEVIIK